MEEYIGAPGGEGITDYPEDNTNYTSDAYGNIVPKYKLVGCEAAYTDEDEARLMHMYHLSEARQASKEQFDRTWKSATDLDKDIEKVVDDNLEELLDSTKGGKGACTEFGFVDPNFNWGNGKKESNGKLSYELDFEFIKQMAERMATNKGKYPPYNWKKPVDIEDLKQATFRHILEIMEGRYEDDGREFGHLEALALNSMFINYQLKNGK